jgi:hypothetical protein
LFNPKKNINYKGIECLNCFQPLHSSDNFCSNCGQKNDIRKPQLFQLLSEFFYSFYALDSKFLRTIIPLLTKPGKVTTDFFDGKRLRYMNPFRFYINVSIFFFLIQSIVGFFETFSEDYTPNMNPKIASSINLDTLEQKKIDSILVANSKDVKQRDSVKENFNQSLVKESLFFKKIETFYKYSESNQLVTTEVALNNLNYPVTFNNRLLYKKTSDILKLKENAAYREQLLNKINSNISIALFLMLPIFALFFKLVYIKRNYSYMEHLVFIFHTQSVFFLLLICFFLFDKTFKTDIGIALLLMSFGFYLYRAMKNFYCQSTMKTFVKYSFLILVFFIISLINLIFISIFSFALT